MRLKTVRINGLFGLFDHAVDLKMIEKITIIHAPNGFGKTVILKMIAGFFGGSLAIFREYDFHTVVFEFDNGNAVVVRQLQVLAHRVNGYRSTRGYKIEYLVGNTVSRWNPEDMSAEGRAITPGALERYVPALTRIGPKTYRTDEGVRLDYNEAVERYWSVLPTAARRGQRHPEWLDAVRDTMACRLIETQRLTIERADLSRTIGSENPKSLAVQSYSDALALSLNKTLAASATLSQSLDRTFPNRILAKMHRPPEFDEKTIRSRLFDLEEKRARLAKVDLLERSDDGALVSHETFDEVARKILGEYIADTSEKLKVFDDLLGRVELLLDLLNSRFNYKTVAVSRTHGLIFKNLNGVPLDVGSLSSGEQHELILLYNLIFNTKPGTLLLIDEPEISLHIAWQKKFLSDLRRVIAVSPMDVILATHSPQLISGNIDLTIQLKGPHNGQ